MGPVGAASGFVLCSNPKFQSKLMPPSEILLVNQREASRERNERHFLNPAFVMLTNSFIVRQEHKQEVHLFVVTLVVRDVDAVFSDKG